MNIIKQLVAVLIALLVFSCGDKNVDQKEQNKISKPGVYKGYSKPIYADDYAISSEYLEMRDGVKIAVDIYRPKNKTTAEVTQDKLPVLWMHTPYNRRYNDPNQEKLNC